MDTLNATPVKLVAARPSGIAQVLNANTTYGAAVERVGHIMHSPSPQARKYRAWLRRIGCELDLVSIETGRVMSFVVNR